VPSFEEIRRALAAHVPRVLPVSGARQAAVAVVLHEGRGDVEVLLIERARREGDPWSGHMAFPGGRVDPGDPDPRRAAERETLEEVGLELASAEILSRLDDLEGTAAGTQSLLISAFVYHAPVRGPLALNDEVTEALWVPLETLLDPARHVAHPYPPGQQTMHFPGIVVGDPGRHVVWGLTYRFLERFFAVLGRRLPAR